jgi:hypothetical protein
MKSDDGKYTECNKDHEYNELSKERLPPGAFAFVRKNSQGSGPQTTHCRIR